MFSAYTKCCTRLHPYLKYVADIDDECSIEGVYGDPLSILSDLQTLHAICLEQQRQASTISVRRQSHHLFSLLAWGVVGHSHALRLTYESLQERLRLNTHVHGQKPQQARHKLCCLRRVRINGVPIKIQVCNDGRLWLNIYVSWIKW